MYFCGGFPTEKCAKLSHGRHPRFFIIPTQSQKFQKMNKLVLEAIQTCKASTKQNRENFSKIKRQFWKLMNQIRNSGLILTENEQSRLEICKIKMQ